LGVPPAQPSGIGWLPGGAKERDPMLTPCIYKRGLIWLLFFVLSFFTVQLLGEDVTGLPDQPKQAESKQQVGDNKKRWGEPHPSGR
jgi:hypothetical protein